MEENVAPASTSVPPAVASEAIVGQSAIQLRSLLDTSVPFAGTVTDATAAD